MNSEFYWLAGLLEAAGCFKVTRQKYREGVGNVYPYPAVSVHMSDEEVVARVARIWGVKHCQMKSNPGVVTFQACITGSKALELMLQMKPMLGTRRQGQIDLALQAIGPKYVAKMRSLGRIAA